MDIGNIRLVVRDVSFQRKVVQLNVSNRKGVLVVSPFDNPDALEIVRGHREDRLLFATDWPWLSHADAKSFIRSAGISQERERKILGENAQTLFG